MNIFQKWFSERLTVGGFPYTVNTQFNPSEYSHCINVSDEFLGDAAFEMLNALCMAHWFPMNEQSDDIGINSIYGALCLMYYSEMKCYKVYLHCHAGAFRSPLVAQCYHFMRTGAHHIKNGEQFEDTPLYEACANGKLPRLEQFELFLKWLGVRLSEGKSTAGYLDFLKRFYI